MLKKQKKENKENNKTSVVKGTEANNLLKP
jgi:hypothetical protein